MHFSFGLQINLKMCTFMQILQFFFFYKTHKTNFVYRYGLLKW
jgi:hypothetical protein